MDEKMMQYLNEMEQRIIQQSARNTQVVIENTVSKQLQLLIEGQQDIAELKKAQ